MKKLITLISCAMILVACNGNVPKATENKGAPAQKGGDVSENNTTSFCHFAKIADKDGYVNIREKESANSTIKGTIRSNEVVYIFEDSGTDWLDVSYVDENNIERSGYVHRSRIKYINSLELIPSVIDDENGVNFILRDIIAEIKTDSFDYELNKKYFSETKHDDFILTKYKGKEMWGTDGTIPQTYYQSITVTAGNQTVKIPVQDIEDLFNANNQYTECYYDKADNAIYIHLSNSDAAGSYVVLFKIENGVYKGRQVEIPF